MVYIWTDQCDHIPGRHGEDIGTRDPVLAARNCIHGSLGLDHCVETIPGKRQVVGVVFLCLVVRSRLDNDRSVTTLSKNQQVNQIAVNM